MSSHTSRKQLPSDPTLRVCRVMIRTGLRLLACIAIGACSTLPPNVDRFASTAFEDTGGTRLAKVAMASQPADIRPDGDVSGIQLVSRGEEAFGSLYTLISHAERSLDLQYYIVRDDPYARTLLRAAREAASAAFASDC